MTIVNMAVDKMILGIKTIFKMSVCIMSVGKISVNAMS